MTASPNTTREGTFASKPKRFPFIDDVYRFALSLTRDAADADDIVQETFLARIGPGTRSSPEAMRDGGCSRSPEMCFFEPRERERRHVDLEDGDVEAASTFATHGQMVRDGADQILSRVDLAPASVARWTSWMSLQVSCAARRPGEPVVRGGVADSRRTYRYRSFAPFPWTAHSPGQAHYLRARRRVHDRTTRPTRNEG
jgi:hypothetical protein